MVAAAVTAPTRRHAGFLRGVAGPLLLAFALALPLRGGAATRLGDPFPALANRDVVNLAGGALPPLRGKVTLVDFWASWCAPCQASFPAMAALYREYASRGLQIVAISVDEKPAAAVAFWKRMAPPFITLHDRRQKLVETVVVPAMPTSYLLDRTGHVRYVHVGYHGEVAELRRQIEGLLGPATAAEPRDARPRTKD